MWLRPEERAGMWMCSQEEDWMEKSRFRWTGESSPLGNRSGPERQMAAELRLQVPSDRDVPMIVEVRELQTSASGRETTEEDSLEAENVCQMMTENEELIREDPGVKIQTGERRIRGKVVIRNAEDAMKLLVRIRRKKADQTGDRETEEAEGGKTQTQERKKPEDRKDRKDSPQSAVGAGHTVHNSICVYQNLL